MAKIARPHPIWISFLYSKLPSPEPPFSFDRDCPAGRRSPHRPAGDIAWSYVHSGPVYP